MTTNTDKLAAHMALRERAFSLAESQDSIADVRLAGAPTFVSTHSGNLARNTANTLRELAQALEAAGRVQQAEPVAVLRFQRDTPGHENDMPAVVSCNWLPDGDYRVYLATPAERAPAPTVAEAHTDRAPLGFTDHEKSAWSIGVEHGMRIAAPTAQEASKPVQAEAAKTPGMAVMGLAGEIVVALLADENDGGYDLEAGLFGPAFSTLVRRWADAEWLATQPQAIPAAPAVQDSREREHAENYKLIRRGQHWSVIDGMGNTLRGDDLDAAVDAIRARICAALASPPASGEKP